MHSPADLPSGQWPAPVSTLEAARVMFAQLQARAAAQHVVLRHPPPEPTSCCGRGCNGCVWEGFFDATAFWREDAIEALTERT